MRTPLNGFRSQISSVIASSDEDQGVAAAQLAHRPILQCDALDLNVGEPADPVLVGRVGPLRTRVAFGPGLEGAASRSCERPPRRRTRCRFSPKRSATVSPPVLLIAVVRDLGHAARSASADFPDNPVEKLARRAESQGTLRNADRASSRGFGSGRAGRGKLRHPAECARLDSNQ